MSMLLIVDQLQKYYPMRSGRRNWRWWRAARCKPLRSCLYAVDDISFGLEEGECLGVVGESGCGKSTLVYLLARLIDPSAGRIVFDGKDLSRIPAQEFAQAKARAQLQVVFQNSAESLNPRLTILDCMAEPWRRLQGVESRHELVARVGDFIDRVGLPDDVFLRLPHQLTEGQKVCVNIARAIALRPRLLILDEPTAGLDISAQSLVLQLLDTLRRNFGMTCIMVSLDLNVMRLLSDRVMVMYQGRIAEIGITEDVLQRPLHPYTQALVSAMPAPDNRQGFERITLYGQLGRAIDPKPEACRLAERCPKSQDLCRQVRPVLKRHAPHHSVACHAV
ncbi:peptide ABC transporter ATP-binding protein [Candidatus Entotheonella serta]|nr:peptide ABC transporter ATP-binding protein [Candidatus Entotheonella serta]